MPVSPMERTQLKRFKRHMTSASEKITASTILPILSEEIRTMTICRTSTKQMKLASIRLWIGLREKRSSPLLLRLTWLEYQALTTSRPTSTPALLGLETLVGAKRGKLEMPQRTMRRCPVSWKAAVGPCNG